MTLVLNIWNSKTAENFLPVFSGDVSRYFLATDERSEWSRACRENSLEVTTVKLRLFWRHCNSYYRICAHFKRNSFRGNRESTYLVRLVQLNDCDFFEDMIKKLPIQHVTGQVIWWTDKKLNNGDGCICCVLKFVRRFKQSLPANM